MGCCNFKGRDCEPGVSCDSGSSDAKSFVIFFLTDYDVQLISHTGYGKKSPEFYIRADGVRISLYWNNESQAWIDASNRLKEFIPKFDLKEILK